MNDFQGMGSGKALLKDYYAASSGRTPLGQALSRRRKKLTRTHLGGDILSDSLDGDIKPTFGRKKNGFL